MDGSNPPVAEGKKIEETNTFNLKWLVSTILAIWPWLLGSIIISLIAGNLYLRYSTPIYRSYAELLIMDSKKGSSTSGDDIAQMLKIDNNKINIDNEIEVLKSRTTMAKVVKQLHLNVNYSVSGRFKVTQVYNNKPFEFVVADTTDDYYDCKVSIVSNDNYQIIDGNSKIITGRWGDTVSVSLGKVVLNKTALFSPSPTQYTINVVPIIDAANGYMYSVDISSPAKSASYITLSMQDNLPERSVDIINALMHIYMRDNVDNRNRVSNSTIAFIDERIDDVFRELSGVESNIEKFKQNNNIADMTTQSQELVKANSETLEKLANKEVELDVITAISNYLQKADDKSIILPASLLDNSGLSALMDKFNDLQTQIENNLISNTSDNPITKTLIFQKNEVKQSIIASLASSKSEVELTVNKIKSELGIIDRHINEVPQVERKYLEYARLQAIKQDIYVFLLKKREETAIQKAATVADASVIDPAITVGIVLPNRSRILMISLLFGIAVPFGVILLRRGLNIKIISISDIKKLSSIPIFGEVGNNQDGTSIAVTRNSRTIISEQFRALRTNLQYVLINKNDKVLMITSSMSGEGKSFIAVNLSVTLAMSGKKVILLELDLRKPKISKTINIDNSVGFTNYAIGKAEYKDIIVPSGIDPNLFILSSGPVPPNPSELILLKRTEELFQRLKEDFDYVIIDTSPVGLVTDAQLLNTYADTTLYIIRQGHTYKQQLNIPNDLYNSGKITRIGFIVNDVVANRGFAYGYGYEEGYGYGYGYGYGAYGAGYYTENKRKGILGWFTRKRGSRS